MTKKTSFDRRLIACVLAMLLVTGLVPVLPEAPRALAEEATGVIVLGDDAADKGVSELGKDAPEGTVELGGSGPSEADDQGVEVVLDKAAEDAQLDQPKLVAREDPATDEDDVTDDMESLEPQVENEPVLQAQSVSVSNPRIRADASMRSGQVTTWDCVWFGSYPQTEVAPGDAVYASLQSASWDADGDAVVGGARYRRISKSDATDSWYWSGVGYSSAACRYFRYEPIKWRVLEASGSTALVVADVALDDQEYNENYTSVTWETSSVRSWLNGYGASSNQPGTDFTGKSFVGSAFSSAERSAILATDVANADNTRYGTEGGNYTSDKVFLLSEAEVYDTSHGFVSSYGTCDEARRCKVSDYARAMGAYRYSGGTYDGNCWWWLRSPGYYAYCAADVGYDGYVSRYGDGVNVGCAVRPALNLNLASPNLQAAGTVSSNGVVNEQASTGTGSGDPQTPEKPTDVAYARVYINGSNSDTNVRVRWTGSAIEPEVSVWMSDDSDFGQSPLVRDKDYTVRFGDNEEPGTASVTIKGIGSYSGEKTVSFTIVKGFQAYLPSVNGWGFTHGDALDASAKISERAFYRVFDRDKKGESLYKQKKVVHGLCEGLAITSAMTYLGKPPVTSWSNGDITTPSRFRSLNLDDVSSVAELSLIEYIQASWLYQFTKEGSSQYWENWSNGLNGWAHLDEMVNRVEAFHKTGSDPIVIVVRGFNPQSNHVEGHDLVPYRVERGESVDKLYVYDCNYGQDNGRYIELTKDTNGRYNGWSYQLFDKDDGDLTWSSGFMHFGAMITYYGYFDALNPVFGKQGGSMGREAGSETLFTSSSSDLRVSDSLGHSITFDSGNVDGDIGTTLLPVLESRVSSNDTTNQTPPMVLRCSRLRRGGNAYSF